jgi:hypothetical protein
MDIGCFQVKRVLQDVEQKVRVRGRNEEMDRSKWLRTAEKKRAEVDSRRADLRGQVGKRFQTLERKDRLDKDIQPAPLMGGVPTAREQAGFQLLAQLLAEAGEQGRDILSAAAGLSQGVARQARPLALADALCARCEGLSELVLDLTDQLTAEVMGIRPAAVEELGGPRSGPSLEDDVARGWTPPATSRQHTLIPTTTLGAHPFADADTLEFMLDQLLVMLSSAASLATQSHCVQPDTEEARSVTSSPLSMMDSAMMAALKAQIDGEQSAEDLTESPPKSAVESWKRLKAKRKATLMANETVAQIAPILLKHGLMDFARQLKKYGFHRLPALRKASVGQLVQLGMSSTQATTLLRAVTGRGTAGEEEANDGRSSVTKRAHGVEISNEAWFYKAEMEPEPERPPVTMADLRPAPRRPSPRGHHVHGKTDAAIQSLVSGPGVDDVVKRDDRADANDEPAQRTIRPHQQTDSKFLEAEKKSVAQQHAKERVDYKEGVKRRALAVKKEMREEQEANDWLRARPADHRTIVVPEKASKDAAVKQVLRKGTQMPHLKGIIDHPGSSRKLLNDRTASELSTGSPAIGTTAGMRFSESSGSFGGQIYEQQSGSQQSLVELDNEIFFWKTKAPRTAHVHVGDPRFLPTGTVLGHTANASFTGRKFINRWSSLQSHSPESIESRKQALRVAKAWQPKTTRSFRVERVLGT